MRLLGYEKNSYILHFDNRINRIFRIFRIREGVCGNWQGRVLGRLWQYAEQMPNRGGWSAI